MARATPAARPFAGSRPTGRTESDLELLTPFAAQRYERLDERHEAVARHVPALPELTVEVTDAAG